MNKTHVQLFQDADLHVLQKFNYKKKLSTTIGVLSKVGLGSFLHAIVQTVLINSICQRTYSLHFKDDVNL